MVISTNRIIILHAVKEYLQNAIKWQANMV